MGLITVVLLANRSAQLYGVANRDQCLAQRGGERQNETVRVPESERCG